MGRPKRYTNKQIDEVYRMFVTENKRVADVAEATGIPSGTISYLCKQKRDELGVSDRKLKHGEDIKRKALRMFFIDTVSVQNIAIEMGLNRNTVSSWVHSARHGKQIYKNIMIDIRKEIDERGIQPKEAKTSNKSIKEFHKRGFEWFLQVDELEELNELRQEYNNDICRYAAGVSDDDYDRMIYYADILIKYREELI